MKLGLRHIKYHLLAILIVAVWGVSFINTRVLLDAGLSPIEIYVYRFIISYVCMLPFSRFKVRILPWRDELMMLWCGLTGGTLYFLAENTAINLTLVSDVAVLVSLNPLLTIMLAAIFLRDEHFTWLKVAGSVIAFAGVALLTFYDGFVWGDGLLGDLLALGAALVWAAYSVILKRLNNKYDALTITRKTFFYGLLTVLPLMPSQELSPMSTLMRPDVVANMLFLTLVCSMLAFYVWSVVTKEIGTINSTNYLYLSPIISLIAAAVILGERVGALGLLGCAMILAGVIIVERKHS